MIEIDEKAFNDALNAVAATPDGKIVLACIKEFTRFDGDILVEGSPQDTYANATLRRTWLYLRGRINVKHLKSIEFYYKRKVEYAGRTSATDRPEQPINKLRRTGSVQK